LSARKKILAVIGNGMATCRLLDELVDRKALLRYDVVVYGEERGGAYNRILLSKVLGGAAPESIITKPRAWYEAHGIRLHDGAVVKRLDTASKQIETADGALHRYDAAVLATGSQPLVPPLDGMMVAGGELRPGVFVYRTMDDCARMRAHARAGDTAVVLGGGLLGLEAAKVLADRGLHVTVIHASKTLMNAQLDELGGEMLEREIERCGIFVRTARTIEAVVGDIAVDASARNSIRANGLIEAKNSSSGRNSCAGGSSGRARSPCSSRWRLSVSFQNAATAASTAPCATTVVDAGR